MTTKEESSHHPKRCSKYYDLGYLGVEKDFPEQISVTL